MRDGSMELYDPAATASYAEREARRHCQQVAVVIEGEVYHLLWTVHPAGTAPPGLVAVQAVTDPSKVITGELVNARTGKTHPFTDSPYAAGSRAAGSSQRV